jgi:hypothetical protein
MKSPISCGILIITLPRKLFPAFLWPPMPLKVVPKPARNSENCSEASYECMLDSWPIGARPEKKFDAAFGTTSRANKHFRRGKIVSMLIFIWKKRATDLKPFAQVKKVRIGFHWPSNRGCLSIFILTRSCASSGGLARVESAEIKLCYDTQGGACTNWGFAHERAIQWQGRAGYLVPPPAP